MIAQVCNSWGRNEDDLNFENLELFYGRSVIFKQYCIIKFVKKVLWNIENRMVK